MKYYAYEDFKTDTNKLIKMVSEFKPQVIVGIARGGLTLAHAMSEGMDIRDVQSIRTELYDKTSKRDSITISGECIFDKVLKVLVVDDIADSGETLEVVMKILTSSYAAIEFKSATLFYKETSVYEPHYWLNKADGWIDFFWERDFTNKT